MPGQDPGKVTTPVRDCPDAKPGKAQRPRVTSLQLSKRASSQLAIPNPKVETAPPRGKRMLIRMPTWFWPAESQWKPRSTTAQVDDVWAKATASPYRMVIDPGDGTDPFDCAAPWVPYDEETDVETACTHTYRHSGSYTVDVTVQWGADWAGSDGNGGTLPTLSRSTNFPTKVVESRSELIDP